MTIQHNIIADPDIHEPKGVATAASNSLYVANGSGSGVWTVPAPLAGFPSALDGQVFISDGAGSGTWEYPPAKGHAEIYINEGTTAHLLAAGSTYTKLNPTGEWTASTFEDILSVDAADGEIILSLAGHYKIDFWCNFTTDSVAANKLYYFKFALDGVTSTRTVTVQKHTSGVDTLHIAASGFVSATAGQRLSMYVAGDASTSETDIIVIDSGLLALHLD